MRYLSLDDEIFIHQFIQNIHPYDTIKVWFDAKKFEDKKKILLDVLDFVIQSHPTYEEIFQAAQELKLSKAPVTVKMLNQAKPFAKFGYELANLPEKELDRGFFLLLKILSIADSRRKRTCCSNGCHHWWHKDLSDISILKEIKEGIRF